MVRFTLLPEAAVARTHLRKLIIFVIGVVDFRIHYDFTLFRENGESRIIISLIMQYKFT